MFEQESYNQEVSEVPMHPGDLFYNYEIRNWNFSPRLYKILGFSAVFNIVLLVGIASSGVLTARGCDSPFVGRVCQVLDTVYVGSLLFGTDNEYADVDYEKTELQNADITFVDVTGVTPPLSYPEGYFQLANPEQQFANVTDPMMTTPGFIAPGIPYSSPSISGSGLINTPAIKPNANPNAIQGKFPDDSSETSESEDQAIPGNRKGRRGGKVSDATVAANSNSATGNPSANTNAGNTAAAQNQDETKEDAWGVSINKRPLRLEATESLEKLEAKKVNLETPFKVVITASVGVAKDGKTVVLKNAKPVVAGQPVKNDPEMEKFVQDWILAVGDAGWFGHITRLADPKPKTLIITVEQNNTDLIASVQADQPNEEKARTMQSSLSLFLGGATLLASGDNRTFLEKASVTSEGKNFILNFKIPKSDVKDM